MARPIITLTTDFGLRDPYVAEMKAVILSICPETTIVDVSHEIEKFNVRMAAFVLACAVPYFPKGTIYVAVVDPGVGTKRKPMLIQTRNAIYIGPDNGILALATKNDKPIQIREITNRKFMMPQISNTFHGRDIFAPTAAHIADGTELEMIGREIQKIVRPSFAKVVRKKNTLVGEVIHVDSFGNIVTNVDRAELELIVTGLRISVRLGDTEREMRLVNAYAEGERGEPSVLVGSNNLIEIFVNRGNAAEALRVRNGDKIAIRVTRS
jgi:S-adenosylmethionine hydrolase